MANLGWDEVTLPHPVFEGDTIYSKSEVLSKRPSTSRPNVGVLSVQTEGFNQDLATVITFVARSSFTVAATGRRYRCALVATVRRPRRRSSRTLKNPHRPTGPEVILVENKSRDLAQHRLNQSCGGLADGKFW